MSRGRAHRLLVLLVVFVVVAGASAATPSGSVARISVGTWKIVPSPAVAGGELIAVAALNTSDAWAVGTRAVSGVFSPLAEHWNGSTWTVIPLPVPSSSNFNELFGVTMISSSNVWAVGVSNNWSSLIEHWNGTAWKVVPSPTTGPQTPLYGVFGFAASNVWAAGQKGVHGTLLHYNGSSWSVFPHPEPVGSTYTTFSKVAGVSPTDVWAVGESQTSSQQTLVEHFNGTSWKIVPSAVQGAYNYVRGLAVRTTGDAWLVGDWEGPGPSYPENPLIQHWNGTAWTAVKSPVGEPWGVAALSSADAWLVGNQPSASANYVALIEHWNGTSWSVVQPPSLGAGDSELNGLAGLASGLLWAVGNYSPSGTDRPLILMNPAG